MIGVGGLTHKHYAETRGIKVSDGQLVSRNSILTREGNRWKAGLNVKGRSTLYAVCDGTVYFTVKRGTYKTNKRYTFINIKPKVLKASPKREES